MSTQLALALPVPVELDPADTPGLVAGLIARAQPRWAAAAACTGAKDPDAWFPEPPADTLGDLAGALRTCRHCPVRRACLAAGLAGNETGIWGGTLDADREHATRALVVGADIDTTLDGLLANVTAAEKSPALGRGAA